jgi:hypothetical protein
MLKLHDVTLTCVYGDAGQLIQFQYCTLHTSMFRISILDKSQDEHTGETSFDFESIDELKGILQNFESRFKLINNVDDEDEKEKS